MIVPSLRCSQAAVPEWLNTAYEDHDALLFNLQTGFTLDSVRAFPAPLARAFDLSLLTPE